MPFDIILHYMTIIFLIEYISTDHDSRYISPCRSIKRIAIDDGRVACAA